MKIPLFKYPTRIGWIDDSEILTGSIMDAKKEFEPFIIQTFLCATEFLDSMKNSYYQNDNQISISMNDNFHINSTVNNGLKIDYRKMSDSIEKYQITDEISVIVVDKNMPGINGINLCKKLIDFPFKKLLLTGYINDEEINNAISDRTIDYYIRKGNDSLIDEIKIHIDLLSDKYFIEKSSNLLSFLETNNIYHLSDDVFISLFGQWCAINRIIRYCVTDDFGNIKAIDDEQIVKYFIIYSKESLLKYLKINNLSDSKDKYTNTFSTEFRIPFLDNVNKSENSAGELCSNSFYPCKILYGRTEYYWCVIDSVNV